MPKLYLVGVTEDRDGLVLAKSPRAKSGDSVLEVDADVLDAIAEIRRYRSEGALPPPISSPALPTRHRPTGDGPTASSLSPREIQSRLRRGESIESVARRAGIEAWRIEVYAAPIAAEQARIVARARELDMEKRGAGPSGRPLGESVQANVVEKRVSMNVDEFESAWSAYEPEPDQWVVQFRYTSRGRDQLAEWTYDPEEEVIVPANRLATTLGWRDPKKPGRLRPLPEAPRGGVAPPKKKPAKKRAPAKKKAPASKKKPAKKRAPAKKKAPASKKKPAKKRAPAKKPASKKKPTKKPASTKKAPPKKAVKKKAVKKKAVKKKAVKKKAPAKKATKTPAKKKAPATGKSGTRRSSSKSKRSKAPPASGPTGGWREELARRVAQDRAAAGERRGSWRVEPSASARDGERFDDVADPPSWLQPDDPAPPDEAGEVGPDAPETFDDGDDHDGPEGDDDGHAGADPTRSHVRVMAPRASDLSQSRGRRRRFRRVRRAE